MTDYKSAASFSSIYTDGLSREQQGKRCGLNLFQETTLLMHYSASWASSLFRAPVISRDLLSRLTRACWRRSTMRGSCVMNHAPPNPSSKQDEARLFLLSTNVNHLAKLQNSCHHLFHELLIRSQQQVALQTETTAIAWSCSSSWFFLVSRMRIHLCRACYLAAWLPGRLAASPRRPLIPSSLCSRTPLNDNKTPCTEPMQLQSTSIAWVLWSCEHWLCHPFRCLLRSHDSLNSSQKKSFFARQLGRLI